MKKLFTKFKLPELHKNAAKVIKIQIKYLRRDWRRQNHKIIQLPYYYVKFYPADDWLDFEAGPEQMALQELLMNEEDIRMLNNDFNYKNYGCFYEQLEKVEGESNLKEAKEERGFEKIISENNILNQMWNRVHLDPTITANYEQWLEDEVWTYFD